jgi:hypothetical protein
MLFSLVFAHGPIVCPAAHTDKMEGFTRLLSSDILAERQITLLEGYVDKLCLSPGVKDHFSYFVFETDSGQKMHELAQNVRELFRPASVELRKVQRWGELTKAVAS